jgi:hypothetical protein
MSNKGPWVKSEHVLPLIELGAREYDSEHNFALAMGFKDARRFYAIRHEQVYVAFDFLDKILVFLNMEYLFHFPASEGGFEDLLIKHKDINIYKICPKCRQDPKKVNPDCRRCVQRQATRVRLARKRKSPTKDADLKGAKEVLARDGA